MREEVPRLIHNVDSLLTIGDSHVHVQTKNETCARNLLRVFDNGCIAFMDRYELIHPMRKRVRAGGADLQSVLPGKFGQFAAKIDNLSSGITRVAANFSAQLHDRLMQL